MKIKLFANMAFSAASVIAYAFIVEIMGPWALLLWLDKVDDGGSQ